MDGADGMSWVDAREIGLEGRAFADTEAPYDRLPADARGKVTDAVWTLQRDSAGICVRFRTGAPEIGVRWSLVSGEIASTHMAATGVSGVDLYALPRRAPPVLRHGPARSGQAGNVARLPGSPDGTLREFQLDLPLYNGIASLEIGTAPGTRVEAVPGGPLRPRVCFYGTSIVQGGCASRPGMAYPAIIGRALGVGCFNLGFSGSARSEPEMAEILSRVDAQAFVLDPLPNMARDTITERLGHMVRLLRRTQPAAPIVLVEHVRPSRPHLPGDPPWVEDSREANAILGALVAELRDEGVDGLHLVPASRPHRRRRRGDRGRHPSHGPRVHADGGSDRRRPARGSGSARRLNAGSPRSLNPRNPSGVSRRPASSASPARCRSGTTGVRRRSAPPPCSSSDEPTTEPSAGFTHSTR